MGHAVNSNTVYRAMLLEKQAAVLPALGVKVDTLLLAGTGRINEEDQAQLEHEGFVSMRLNNLDHEQLLLVKEALDRIATGHYGVCLRCDKPVAGKRLKALPWARYCVTCQEAVAREERERSSGAEVAQLEHEECVSMRLNNLDHEQLLLVKEALDRIYAGHYGVCLRCDEPVARKRLKALPWARYCVTCQEAIAREEREESSAAVVEMLFRPGEKYAYR